MLVIAAILFAVAVLLAFVDWWMQNADIEFGVPVKLLLFISAALVSLNVYLST